MGQARSCSLYGDRAVGNLQGTIAVQLQPDPALAARKPGDGRGGERGAWRGSWWKLGIPIFYVTDVLQIVEALVALGHGADPRLSAVIALIQSKRDAQGRRPLSG